jgi:hypothetical protein
LGVGLIVTGGRNLGRRRWFLSRSFAMDLFHRARCPVLIVRGEIGAEPGAPGWSRPLFVGLPLWWPVTG